MSKNNSNTSEIDVTNTSPETSGNQSTDEELSEDAIQEHYQKANEALAPLGELNEHSQTIANSDCVSWYLTRENPSPTTQEAMDGFTKERRAQLLTADYEQIIADTDRTLYAITSYNHPNGIDWEPARAEDDGWEYLSGEKPTPDVDSMTALAVWGDIDLNDDEDADLDFKSERGNGGLDADTQQIAENAYQAYVNEYAKLVGGTDAVFALDSVGGMYVMTAPSVTQPIAKKFGEEKEKCELIFDELLDRSNDYLHGVEQRVNEEVDGAADVVKPDWVNNANRPYKAPLSVHADHDAVVTPVEEDDVSFTAEPTAFDSVDDNLRAYTQSWSEAFTSEEFENRISILVENLWPEYSAEHSNWREALDAWATETLDEREEREEARKEARERVQQRQEEYGSAIIGVGVTPEKQAVYDAVDAVPIVEIAKKYAADEWEPTGRTNHFNPCWRDSDSGTSVFVDPDENIFGDVGSGQGGGDSLKLMALAEGIIGSPDETVTGSDYWDAVEALREAGYNIPVHVPEAGDEHDKTPRWTLVDAAQAMDVIPPEMFIVQDTADGDSYFDFGSAWGIERTLEELENLGIDHGWTDDDIPDSADDDIGMDAKYVGTKVGNFVNQIQGHMADDIVMDYPIYDINDEHEIHLIPLTGSKFRMTIVATEAHPSTERGEIIASENLTHKPNTIDLRNDLDSTHKRKSRAKNLHDETGINKSQILDVLSSIASDLMEEDTQEKMQSSMHRWIKQQVEEVQFYPAENGDSVYKVSMKPDPRRPSRGSVTFTLDPEMLVNDSPAGFKGMYTTMYGAEIKDLDGTSWSIISSNWIATENDAQPEPDNDEDAFVDAFRDRIDNEFKVFANNDAGEKPSKTACRNRAESMSRTSRLKMGTSETLCSFLEFGQTSSNATRNSRGARSASFETAIFSPRHRSGQTRVMDGPIVHRCGRLMPPTRNGQQQMRLTTPTITVLPELPLTGMAVTGNDGESPDRAARH